MTWNEDTLTRFRRHELETAAAAILRAIATGQQKKGEGALSSFVRNGEPVKDESAILQSKKKSEKRSLSSIHNNYCRTN